mmetsp:Transcript_42587/g.87023  ORF Transcript_42587/g.87023 Transcript_42587/m.87023 type:complete len:208 (-) Transcript_42587:19-642(-)
MNTSPGGAVQTSPTAGSSKLDRWMKRTIANRTNPSPRPQTAQGGGAVPLVAMGQSPAAADATSSKLGRWLARSVAQNKAQATANSPGNASSASSISTPPPDPNHPHVTMVQPPPDNSNLSTSSPAGPVVSPRTPQGPPPGGVAQTVPAETGWERYVYTGGEYEGGFKEQCPHGFGRNIWDSGMAYHGEWVKGEMQGTGVFFFPNGDT